MEKTLFDGPHFELDELARRLAARKTPAAVYPRAGSGVWDDATKANLRVLWAEGHSVAEIGRRLGFSKNAAVGKAHRLGLAPRESPIAKGLNNRAPRSLRIVPPPLRIGGSTLPPLASLIEPLPVFQDVPPRRPEPPARCYIALPVSGVPAAPRPVPCPCVPRPAREPGRPRRYP